MNSQLRLGAMQSVYLEFMDSSSQFRFISLTRFICFMILPLLVRVMTNEEQYHLSPVFSINRSALSYPKSTHGLDVVVPPVPGASHREPPSTSTPAGSPPCPAPVLGRIGRFCLACRARLSGSAVDGLPHPHRLWNRGSILHSQEEGGVLFELDHYGRLL